MKRVREGRLIDTAAERSERGRAVAARKGDGERWKGGRDWRGGRARKVEREESRWKSRGRRFEMEAKLFSGLAGWLAGCRENAVAVPGRRPLLIPSSN